VTPLGGHIVVHCRPSLTLPSRNLTGG
jgi:hypothetical protein